ncbi:MAG: DUF1573 domain-containing protein [Alistipes sp.]|nr:DUF1573 domain-containing protein [Candidatus Alistipes equi]
MRFLLYNLYLAKSFAKLKQSTIDRWTMLFVLVWVVVAGRAQSSLVFKEYEWNFGQIMEDGGKVSHDFIFTNENDDPVIILGASTSCGCTKAYFSREPIKNGGSSSIRIEYDPMYSPGIFHQSISVHTNHGSMTKKLVITGYVIERKKSPEERYPLTLIGDVRIESNSVDFSTVEHGEEKWMAIGLINLSKRKVPMRLENKNTSSALEIVYPQYIDAGQSATINLGYKPPVESSQYGPISESIDIYIGSTKIRFPIMVHAVITDALSKNNTSNSPTLFISHNFIKFGKCRDTEQMPWYSIKLKNTGDGILKLRDISSRKGLMDIKLASKAELKPMESTIIKVRFRHPFPSFGILTDRICITTNEPKEPFKCIRASVIIEKQE